MRSPSPASVIATVALIVALSGTGIAATQLARNSVGTAQLKTGAVTAAKVKKGAVTSAAVLDGSLAAADFRAGTFVPGPPGPQGATGPQGPKGDDGVATPGAWVTIGAPGAPAFGTGWGASVAGTAPGYRLDGAGNVQLRGVAGRAADSVDGSTIFFLPADLTPGRLSYYPAMSWNPGVGFSTQKMSAFAVLDSGAIAIASSADDRAVSLDGVIIPLG